MLMGARFINSFKFLTIVHRKFGIQNWDLGVRRCVYLDENYGTNPSRYLPGPKTTVKKKSECRFGVSGVLGETFIWLSLLLLLLLALLLQLRPIFKLRISKFRVWVKQSLKQRRWDFLSAPSNSLAQWFRNVDSKILGPTILSVKIDLGTHDVNRQCCSDCYYYSVTVINYNATLTVTITLTTTWYHV